MSVIFITDFDGTLLTDDRRIRGRDLDTLARLRAAGVITVIATGRSLYSFRRALEHMGLGPEDLPLDYLIFSTGAGIMAWPGEQLIRSCSLPKDGVLEIAACFDRIGFDYMIHKAIPDTSYFLFKFTSDNNPDFLRRMTMYPDFGTPLESESGSMIYDQSTEVLAIVPGGLPWEQLDVIRRELSAFSVIPATSPLDHKSAWIEVFPCGVSKSASAQWLARHLGVAREMVTAVGNDYNDEDLLAWAGQGFLMDNSPDVLKKKFPCSGTNNECGVSMAAKAAGLLN
ncbi:HAD family hydrolase [Desulfobacter vibrioformis]|uniref:HAD family hydrolase n=1 Tax=Desulfobacter vibrioformis TaxID=34031 RepID=UPI00055660EC|nr:HAD family hydrolase [Desulfobacter vibrioformis]